MKRRWIAFALALLLMAALPASAASKLPDGFTMEAVISLFNQQLAQAFIRVSGTEAATKVAQYRTYDVNMEGNTFHLSNPDGQVALTGYYQDAEADVSEPVGSLVYTIGKGVNILDRPALKTAFANMVCAADPSANLNALADWIAGADKDGETLDMGGYTLSHARDGNGDTYTLAVEGTGGPSEPDPEPVTEPEPEPEPEPKTETNPEPVQAPADVLLSWKGFSVQPLRTERWLFSDGKPSLRIFLRIVNESPYKLNMRVENMKVDGVSLPATNLFEIKPGTDTGEDSEANILVYPGDETTDAMVQAAVYGSDLSMNLVLEDSKAHDDLYMEKVFLDLDALPCERTVAEPSKTDAPKATKTPAATKAPKVTSKPHYQPLFEGDKGDDVRRMQRKLIDLGYLYGSADGEFGPKTAAAVREFNQTNGLGSDSYASSATLEALYGGSAKAHQEPWVPLIFEDNARGEWKKEKNDQLSFRVKVTNCSRGHTIRAFELYFYATDVWEDKVYGNSIYYGTTTKTIKPGSSAFSDYFLLPNRSQIGKVYCGVKKVIFSDGTIRENNTVDYSSWTIK